MDSGPVNPTMTNSVCIHCHQALEPRVLMVAGREFHFGFSECECSGAIAEREEARKRQEREDLQAEFEARQARIAKMFEGSMMGERFRRRRFETFEADTPEKQTAYKTARAFCQRFAKDPNTRGLFICGKVGTGKTHLAAAIANKVLAEQMRPVIFGTAPRILARIRQSYSGNETQTEWMVLDEICSVPLLIIDDIGKEYAKKANGWSWTQEKTFEIINRRYEDLKPIIFTSNASLEEIAERLDPAIASRIKEMCKGIHCNWEDYRSR